MEEASQDFLETSIVLCEDDLQDMETMDDEDFKDENLSAAEKTISSLWRLTKEQVNPHGLQASQDRQSSNDRGDKRKKRKLTVQDDAMGIPSLFLGYGLNRRSPSENLKDILHPNNASALQAFEQFREDIPRNASQTCDAFIASCDKFYGHLSNRAEDRKMLKELPLQESAPRWSRGCQSVQDSVDQRRFNPASCYMVLMTYPINASNMWATATGSGICHTSQVEEVLQDGFDSADREKALYLDSLPVARSVTEPTRASNDRQHQTFRRGFKRVMASGCKVIIVRHSANRKWLSKMLADSDHTSQEVYDLAWWYQEQHRESVHGIFVYNLFGRAGDHREFIFTAHLSTVGNSSVDADCSEAYLQEALNAYRIVAAAYQIPYDPWDARKSAKPLVAQSAVSDNRYGSCLLGLFVLRKSELTTSELVPFSQIPRPIQLFIKRKIHVNEVPAGKSILFATLSKMATDANHVNGLMALENIGDLTVAQKMTLQEAYRNPKWQSRLNQYEVETFTDLKSAMSINSGKWLENAGNVDAQYADIVRRVCNSLKSLPDNWPRMYCLKCKCPAGYATVDGVHTDINKDHHRNGISLRQAVIDGHVTEEQYATVEDTYLVRGWNLR